MSLFKRKTLKKAISTVTAITTVVWLSGISMLAVSPTAIAAVVDGSLIKSNATNSDGTPTYESLDVYIVKTVGTKKFKRLILNPTVFNSYGHLNYGDIQTVSQAVMDGYATSGLVRVDTDPDERVYAMAPDGDIGSKSWVNLSAADFLSLTGSEDGDSIYTINSTDGGNYNTVGAVTTVVDLETYYTTGELPEDGTAPVETLAVALAATTPASSTYVRDDSGIVAQATADFLAVNFTAPVEGDVKVTNLKVTRSGISADSDLGTIYLYDGGTQIAQHASFSSKVITFNDASGLFTVAAGTTKTINVRADISAGITNVSGIALGIADVAAVTSNASAVSGTFPMNGNTMAVTTVEDLGYVNVTTYTTFPATIDPGQTDKELWRFNVQANDQDMSIENIKMTVVGTIATADVENFKLMVGTTELGAVATLNDSKEIVFDLSASPYTITSGQTKTLIVKGDVVNGSGRAFKFTIRQVGDITVTDDGYSVSVAPLVDGAAFTLIDADSSADGTNINNGTLSVQVASDSPSGNVAAGATGISLAKFEYTAVGEDVKVTAVRVSVNEETGDSDIDNGKLYWNGSQIGTTDADVADEITVPVTTTQIIPAGETATIEYKADITTSSTALAAGQTIVVSLVAGTADATGQSSLSSIATAAATGKTITVATGLVTVAENLTVADATSSLPTAVKGATGAKIGSLVLTAGSGEGASVSQIQLVGDVGSTSVAAAATATPATVTINTNVAMPTTSITDGANWTATGDKTNVPVGSTVNMAVGDTLNTNHNGGQVAVATITRIVSSVLLDTNVSVAGTGAGTTVAVTAQVAVSATSLDQDLLSTGSKTITVTSVTGIAVGDTLDFAGATTGAGLVTAIPYNVLTAVSADITVTMTTVATFAAGWIDVNGGSVVNSDVLAITTSPTPFVVGEAYYVGSDGVETANNFIFTVTSKTAGSVIGTASSVTGTITAGTHIINVRSSASANTDTLADTFQNLKLMQGTTQVGTTISSLTDTLATTYTFTPSTAIEIAAGQQVVFDVLADVKSSGITLSVNSDTTGVISHLLTTATGLDTGNSVNTTAGATALQNVYVAGVGTLVTSIASDTPDSAQVVMGATGVEIARIKLAETSSSEDLNISQIVITDTDATSSFGTLSNIKLMDGTTPLATVATLTAGGLATFPSLSVVIPKGSSKTLSIQADVTAYPGAVSDSTHVLSVALGGVTGIGASSGTSLGTSVASTGTAGTMTAYRTKLTVAYASDTPSGSSSGASDSIVAKFVISNSANIGNYDATLTGMDVAALSSWTCAGAARFIKIYKTSAIVANILGTSSDFTGVPYADTSIGTALTDVTIAAGDDIVIIVTADTQDIASTAGNFAIGLAATDITWSDGVTTAINSVDSLPLTNKTLTYN